jgi:hypothetical protein
MRVNGTTNFSILKSGGTEYDPTSRYAYYNVPSWGPTFGGGNDLLINSNGNVTGMNCRSDLCHSYECPGN